MIICSKTYSFMRGFDFEVFLRLRISVLQQAYSRMHCSSHTQSGVHGVAAKGESFLATYSNDSKRSIEERFELMRNNKTNTNLQNVKI